MKKAINEVKKDGGIVIKPEIYGKAERISVELPKVSISSMVSETNAALKVETPMGTIDIPHDALAAIATQASGSTVTMSLELVDKFSLTPTQQEMVGDKLLRVSLFDNMNKNNIFFLLLLSIDKYRGTFSGYIV